MEGDPEMKEFFDAVKARESAACAASANCRAIPMLTKRPAGRRPVCSHEILE